MKKDIHPNYNEIDAKCACGNEIKIFSTKKNNLVLDVCNMCHPFFTGKQRNIIGKGRVDKFNKKFNFSKKS